MNSVIDQAKAELKEEEFRRLVEQEKTRLQQARWWHLFFPFHITITRRK